MLFQKGEVLGTRVKIQRCERIKINVHELNSKNSIDEKKRLLAQCEGFIDDGV